MKNSYRKYRKLLFAKSGLSACLAFFSFGLMSALSPSSQIDPDIFVSEATSAGTAAAEETDGNIAERCRLQADVALFLSLQDEKNDIPQIDIPCEEKSRVPAALAEKAAPHPDKTLNDTIQEMTAGYPLEAMAPAIAEYDRAIAGLIVGIAKKESDWGKRVPRDSAGADCFNYWGYKGAGTRGVAMGHGCFGSPEEAVAVVGDRLKALVALRQTSKPANMIVWKCGSSCSGHSDESVRKWIADVSLYYDRIASK